MKIKIIDIFDKIIWGSDSCTAVIVNNIVNINMVHCSRVAGVWTPQEEKLFQIDVWKREERLNSLKVNRAHRIIVEGNMQVKQLTDFTIYEDYVPIKSGR